MRERARVEPDCGVVDMRDFGILANTLLGNFALRYN